jgi:hypothetical protein
LNKVAAHRWARLFVFEFFVILLGVLAAQALQGWFADRAERRAAAAAKQTLERNLSGIALSAEARLRSLPCFQYRLGKIAEALNTSTPAVSLRPPDEALVIDLGWSGQTPSLIASHYDVAVVEGFANASLWADALRRAQLAEKDSWRDLGRLSPQLGAVTPADRSIAKGALIGASHSLRDIGYSVRHLSKHAVSLKALPDVKEFEGYRDNKDPCVAAMGYTPKEHQEAARAGRLVTGERF